MWISRRQFAFFKLYFSDKKSFKATAESVEYWVGKIDMAYKYKNKSPDLSTRTFYQKKLIKQKIISNLHLKRGKGLLQLVIFEVYHLLRSIVRPINFVLKLIHPHSLWQNYNVKVPV